MAASVLLVAGLGALQAAPAEVKRWGTPTLTDWNGIWQRAPGRGFAPDIVALPVEPTPAYAPFLRKNQEARTRGLEAGHLARCLPAGTPFYSSLVYPAEFIVRPEQINIIYEIGGDRRIRMNGTHADYIEPSFRGDSIGRWDGDTLLIDTVAITTKTVLSGGARHSNRLRVIERMREVRPNVIENRIRLEDPLALQKPVEYVVTYERAPAGETVQEQACERNYEAEVLRNTYDVFEELPEPPQTEVHWSQP